MCPNTYVGVCHMQVLSGDLQVCLGECRYIYTCGCECVCEDQTPVVGITLQLSCIMLPSPFLLSYMSLCTYVLHMYEHACRGPSLVSVLLSCSLSPYAPGQGLSIRPRAGPFGWLCWPPCSADPLFPPSEARIPNI